MADSGRSTDLPDHQRIYPFTDLLLHDMGEGLAGDRPVLAARGWEWKTPPLWGLGLRVVVNGHPFLFHDGRARTLAEAILWHEGEATESVRLFSNFREADRKSLLAFLESL